MPMAPVNPAVTRLAVIEKHIDFSSLLRASLGIASTAHNIRYALVYLGGPARQWIMRTATSLAVSTPRVAPPSTHSRRRLCP